MLRLSILFVCPVIILGYMNISDDKAVENFREYLRIPSVHPDPDYEPVVAFLRKQAEELQLPIQVFHAVPKKPIVIISWIGRNPKASAILLNSHTDVVPVYEDEWKYPPFEAHMEENGDIYARGSQDMKVVGSMYLEAIKRLKSQGIKFKRTIHLSFVPDEEIGGKDGMGSFIHTKQFKALNIGFSLDEGGILPLNDYPLLYGEKTVWQIHVHCPGTPTHGSIMAGDSPGEKFRYIINKFLELREKTMSEDANDFGAQSNVTSINLTEVYGGILENVVPDMLSAVFDIRLALTQNLTQFENMINKWVEEAGKGVYIEYKQKSKHGLTTSMDRSNPFWAAFKRTLDKLKLDVTPSISTGITDSRFLRDAGVHAFGFTPINQQPFLGHSHNERVNKDKYLKGIGIYQDVLKAVANV